MNSLFVTPTFKAVKIGRVFVNNHKNGAIYYNKGFVNCFVFIPRKSDNIGYCAASLDDLARDLDKIEFFRGRFVIEVNRKGRKLDA